MSTLAVNNPRVYETGHDEMWFDLPMIDNDIIYDGAAVGESGATGYFRPLQAGDKFAGFADSQDGAYFDNTFTGHAAGTANVRVKSRGRVIIPVTNASAVTDYGTLVYASDDNTFTTESVGNSKIGRIERWISATNCVVYFEAEALDLNTNVFAITAVVPTQATLTEQNLFVADRAYQVVAIRVVPDVAQGGALTGTVCKAVSTATPAKTTTPMHTADAIDFNATAHTVQTITLSSTIADLKLAAGNRIGLDLSGALTTGRANITIILKPI